MTTSTHSKRIARSRRRAFSLNHSSDGAPTGDVGTSEHKGRVLVFDDDHVVLELTRDRLESVGYEVHTHRHGANALVAIASEAPDVVMMDPAMCGTSGALLVDKIRHRFSAAELPILFHSAAGPQKLEDFVAKKGAVGAVPKTGDDMIFTACFDRLFLRAMGSREKKAPSFSIPGPFA
jgi:CheY-like chemotaxis protein